MKYLVLFVVVVVGLMVFKRSQQRPIHRTGKRKALAPPEPMHACQHCGVHVPASRCVWKGERPYCCSEHARLG